MSEKTPPILRRPASSLLSEGAPICGQPSPTKEASEDAPPRRIALLKETAATPIDLPAALSVGAIAEDRHALALYLAEQTKGSRRARRAHAAKIARLLGAPDPQSVPWTSITYEIATVIRLALIETAGPRYGRAVMGALRGILRSAWLAGVYDFGELEKIRAISPIRGSAVRPGRYVPRADLRALFDACGRGTLKSARDRAILAVLFGAGLRRSEASALLVEDIKGGAVIVKKGKGAKGREVPIGVSARAIVDRYQETARGAIGGIGPLFVLFPNMTKGDKPTRQALGGEGIRRLLLTLCTRARVERVRPHDARRTFASDLLGAGVDVSTVARMMGHASISQTAEYDRRGDLAMVEAAGVLWLPVEDHENGRRHE